MITRPERKKLRWLRLILVLPFIVLLWPPFYSIRAPEFAGIPFFYWFQFLWIIITATFTAIVYLAES
jgi:hypothetical protein